MGASEESRRPIRLCWGRTEYGETIPLRGSSRQNLGDGGQLQQQKTSPPDWVRDGRRTLRQVCPTYGRDPPPAELCQSYPQISFSVFACCCEIGPFRLQFGRCRNLAHFLQSLTIARSSTCGHTSPKYGQIWQMSSTLAITKSRLFRDQAQFCSPNLHGTCLGRNLGSFLQGGVVPDTCVASSLQIPHPIPNPDILGCVLNFRLSAISKAAPPERKNNDDKTCFPLACDVGGRAEAAYGRCTGGGTFWKSKTSRSCRCNTSRRPGKTNSGPKLVGAMRLLNLSSPMPRSSGSGETRTFDNLHNHFKPEAAR